MNSGVVSFSPQRFPVEAIKKNIEYLQKEKKKINKGEMSALYAFETAVHLERGMIEHKFFEVFKDDSMELQIILAALRLGTEQHYTELERAWKKERGGSSFEDLSA